MGQPYPVGSNQPPAESGTQLYLSHNFNELKHNVFTYLFLKEKCYPLLNKYRVSSIGKYSLEMCF